MASLRIEVAELFISPCVCEYYTTQERCGFKGPPEPNLCIIYTYTSYVYIIHIYNIYVCICVCVCVEDGSRDLYNALS